jgi:hypothetical protein
MPTPLGVVAVNVSALDIVLFFVAAGITAYIPVAVVLCVWVATRKSRPAVPPDYVSRLEDENRRLREEVDRLKRQQP